MQVSLRRFRVQRGDWLLQGDRLAVSPGELVALIGASGAGKTSLLEGLLGRCAIVADEFSYDGIAAPRQDEGWFARQRRERIAAMTQGVGLFAALSAIDNVAMPALLAGQSSGAARAAAEAILAELELRANATRPAQLLSRGEQQRVALARALAHPGNCVLLDEPTTALDAAARQRVIALLQDRVQRGAAMLIATHDAAIAASAQRLYRIDDGRLLEVRG